MDGGDPAGGSAELARLINQCGECILFDLKHYLQVDLHDVLVDGSGLSPRLVLAYIRQLPLESATVAAIRGGEQFRGWSVITYLLAQQIDSIRENTWVTVSANAKKKPKAPEPYPRPEKKSKKGNLFASMARTQYQKMRSKKNGEPRG